MSTHILRHPTLLSGATRLTADWSNKGGEPDPPRELLRLMPDYHSGLRDYHIWFSMIVPPVEENFDIPLTLRPYVGLWLRRVLDHMVTVYQSQPCRLKEGSRASLWRVAI
jgi:hypothetical protein